MLNEDFDPYFNSSINDYGDFGIHQNNGLDSEDDAHPRRKPRRKRGAAANAANPKPAIKTSQTVPDDLKCQICGKQFKTHPAYFGHIGAHRSQTRKKNQKQLLDSKLFKCKYCGLKFTMKDNLKKHKKMVHKSTKKEKTYEDLINEHFDEFNNDEEFEKELKSIQEETKQYKDSINQN